ncbi:hypothetical protein GCM10009122_27920 [Fulvivirga kasyanovii]|uniref:DUF5723 domain-containing protein n=1 Tax=Fulvivirga kasyanovii TaxID=396812 RepID=A0ABW9RLW3_9BACT|nr:hypothetical protein [Fulvivirga kasyanovii]MTI24976.1 hypothetical protein [Fulvivirga kasyanovii]
MKNYLLLLLLLNSTLIFSQPTQKHSYEKRLVQFSVAPGLGSNGLHPGRYINYFSLNLTSGYSAANALIEVGGFSNLNTDYTRGLQFAALVNITGGNAFARMSVKEVKKYEKEFEANLQGAQFSGLANITLTNVFGLQASGGVNLCGNALFGLQMAGMANVVKNYSFGVQVAGIYNSSVNAMDGVQIASLLNFTGGKLQGGQFGMINSAQLIEGKNSLNKTSATGLQVGLVNRAAKMNGFQIGLINFGGQMQGTQLGLINFYRGGKSADTRDGTSIGLLNIGQSYNIQLYADELFKTNYVISTGTGKNFRKLDANKWVYIQNLLIFGYNPDFLERDHTQWALGYGLHRMVFNRSATPGMNEFMFVSTGVELLHYNKGKEINENLNLLSRFKVSFGSRLHQKVSNLYLFGGVAYNILMANKDIQVAQTFLAEESTSKDTIIKRWAGLHFGVMFH